MANPTDDHPEPLLRAPIDAATEVTSTYAAPDHPTPKAGPSRLGHYAIERKIGEGGMGVVYAARDDRLQRTVAPRRR